MFWCSLYNAIARKLPDIEIKIKINWKLFTIVSYTISLILCIVSIVCFNVQEMNMSDVPLWFLFLCVYNILNPMFLLYWDN